MKITFLAHLITSLILFQSYKSIDHVKIKKTFTVNFKTDSNDKTQITDTLFNKIEIFNTNGKLINEELNEDIKVNHNKKGLVSSIYVINKDGSEELSKSYEYFENDSLKKIIDFKPLEDAFKIEIEFFKNINSESSWLYKREKRFSNSLEIYSTHETFKNSKGKKTKYTEVDKYNEGYTINYLYDSKNNLIEEISPSNFGGSKYTIKQKYEYDELNRQISTTYIEDDDKIGFSFITEYNNENNERTTHGYQYNSNGKIIMESYSTYNKNDKKIKSEEGIWSYKTKTDKKGNITEEKTFLNSKLNKIEIYEYLY